MDHCLVPIYAIDETEAWIEAAQWALENSVSIPESATLIHFPHGFTIHRRVLPGTVHEECI